MARPPSKRGPFKHEFSFVPERGITFQARSLDDNQRLERRTAAEPDEEIQNATMLRNNATHFSSHGTAQVASSFTLNPASSSLVWSKFLVQPHGTTGRIRDHSAGRTDDESPGHTERNILNYIRSCQSQMPGSQLGPGAGLDQNSQPAPGGAVNPLDLNHQMGMPPTATGQQQQQLSHPYPAQLMRKSAITVTGYGLAEGLDGIFAPYHHQISFIKASAAKSMGVPGDAISPILVDITPFLHESPRDFRNNILVNRRFRLHVRCFERSLHQNILVDLYEIKRDDLQASVILGRGFVEATGIMGRLGIPTQPLPSTSAPAADARRVEYESPYARQTRTQTTATGYSLQYQRGFGSYVPSGTGTAPTSYIDGEEGSPKDPLLLGLAAAP